MILKLGSKFNRMKISPQKHLLKIKLFIFQFNLRCPLKFHIISNLFLNVLFEISPHNLHQFSAIFGNWILLMITIHA